MGTIFPFAQLVCELGVAGVLPGRISLSSSWQLAILSDVHAEGWIFLLVLQHWRMWKPLRKNYLK